MGRLQQPLPFLAVVASVAVAVLVGLTLLPHDRYIRFQQMAQESVQYLRAKWIYERIHYDPTPIDVAFIGTSHTQSSIDAELVEQTLRQHGRDWHVVNFAIPRLGRDLHYEIARELLESRHISRLVVELQESEARAPHPAFVSLADVNDVIDAPLVINVDYFDNAARLPLRQTELFFRTLFPVLFNLNRIFDPADYEGAYWNDTYQVHGFTAARTSVFPVEHFEKPVAELRRVFDAKQALGRKLRVPFVRHSLPYRYNLLYLEKLLDLARRSGVEIVFYYMPYFSGPKQPADRELVASYGPILTPQALLEDPSLWQNEDHFNVYGARKASRWIAEALDLLEARRDIAHE
jgi:hypothetical protein